MSGERIGPREERDEEGDAVYGRNWCWVTKKKKERDGRYRPTKDDSKMRVAREG